MAHTILHDWLQRDKKAGIGKKTKKTKKTKKKGTKKGSPRTYETIFGETKEFEGAKPGTYKTIFGETKEFEGAKRRGRKSIEEQMPGEIEDIAMAQPTGKQPVPGGSAPGFPTREGQWIPRTAKKGGRVRGYSSGKRVKASGKIRGAGKVKKGVRKAKMVKMKG